MALNLAEPQGELQIPDFLQSWVLPAEDVTERFKVLADAWRNATRFSSNSAAIASDENYCAIVDLGEQAIPLILQDLRERAGDWYTALEEITGEQPVREDDYGFPRRMKEAWLNWGRANGYI